MLKVSLFKSSLSILIIHNSIKVDIISMQINSFSGLFSAILSIAEIKNIVRNVVKYNKMALSINFIISIFVYV
jgi:hypothetical protein